MDDVLARIEAPPSRWLVGAAAALGFAVLTAGLVTIFAGSFGLLFLLGVLAAIGTLLVAGHPHFGLLLILGMWFSEFSPAILEAEFLRVPYLVGAVLLGPLLLRVATERSLWILGARELRILAAIGALLLVSTWWAGFDHPNLLLPELDRTQRSLVRFASRLVFLVYFAAFMVDRRRIEWTVRTIVLLVAVAAATSWTKVFGEDGIGRAAATFGFAANSNRLAFVCLFATAILWFRRSDGPPGGARPLSLALLGFLPLTALASGSRGGMFQAIVLAGLILREQRAASAARRVQSVAMIACAAVLLFAVVPGALLERTVSFEAHDTAPGGESLRNRMLQLRSGVQLFAQHPLLGIGPGNYDWMSRATWGPGDTAHNSYLLSLTEGGVAVFGLYVALFATTFRTLRRVERHGPPDLRWLGKALRAGLVLFLIASATGDIWLDDPLYWILALAIAASALSFPLAHDGRALASVPGSA